MIGILDVADAEKYGKKKLADQRALVSLVGRW